MAIIFHSLLFLSFSITFAIFYPSPFPLAEAHLVGFSVDLIHREYSPSSPFYNSSLTPPQRLSKALKRSANRVRYLHSVRSKPPKWASGKIISSEGEYLLNISIGTPPFSILAIADTGSNLAWTQCTPCKHCYKQKDPLFDPRSSSTYKKESCDSDSCQSVGSTSCDKSTCKYQIVYGDGSSSDGVVARETVTFGATTNKSESVVTLPGIIFGCGYKNRGSFADGSGVIGLGHGPASLISQIRPSIGGKFSYCMVPISDDSTATTLTTTKSSQVHFGDNAIVSGTGVVSTPIHDSQDPTFYYLTMEGITVGNRRLDFYTSSTPQSPSLSPTKPRSYGIGNIIIDSGTTLTYLPKDLYDRVEAEIARAVRVKPIPDPEKQLSLCYNVSAGDVLFPNITAHFAGADVKLNHFNAFVGTADGVDCLAFSGDGVISIWGNLAQMNFLVGYDLDKKTVSFKPTDCAKGYYNSEATKSGQMLFGDNAGVLGTGVVSTRIAWKNPCTFYFLTLEGLRAGSQKVKFYNSSSSSSTKNGFGNIMIDSGTTMTFLPTGVYLLQESAVGRAVVGVEPKGVLVTRKGF